MSSLPDSDPPDQPGAALPAAKDLSLHQLLLAAVEKNASDLHVTVGSPPCLRIGGDMVPLRTEPLSARDTSRICQTVFTEQQIERFAAHHSLRMSFGVRDLGRFRGSFFMQRGAMTGVYRVIPFAIPALETLGLSALGSLTSLKRGLILVGGPLGSGKSTTLASLFATIARERSGHLLTIEDPIEFLVPHTGTSLIAQIEIGADYPVFKDAFAAGMAQDPDVLLLSELTGADIIEAAIEAAETGRLVIGSSPSRSIAKAIARLVDAYPTDMQARARARLADVLEAVTCQSIASANGSRRVTCELVTADAGLRARVRDGSALVEG